MGNELLVVGIAIFVVMLLWYPFARKRPPENRFLENLTLWKWVLYSIITVCGTLIIAALIRGLMDNL